MSLSREELLDKLADAVVRGKVDQAKEGAQEVLAGGGSNRSRSNQRWAC
ncbi:hypothetical protein [Candidatus Methanomassiliicoccus intestinalis]